MGTHERVASWFVFALLFSFSASTPHADKVILKDGKEIQCKVLRETETKVEIEVRGSKISLPKSRIKSIEKLDPATNAIAQGDALFAGRKYAEAIEAYNKALSAKPDEAKTRIAAAKKAMAKAVDEAIAGMPPAAAEKQLRARLATPNLSDDESSRTKARLARVLMKRADLAALRRDYAQGTRCLEEAWRLAPETSGVVVALVSSLQKRAPNDRRIVQILQPYVAKNPKDIEAVVLLADQLRQTDPWAALKLIYPNNKPHPKAPVATKNLLAEILLACATSKSYPADAPFDRVSCCERLLALKPNADKAPLFLARAEREPENLQHLYDLGNWYERQDKLDKAKATFAQVERHNPAFKDITRRMEQVESKIKTLQRRAMARRAKTARIGKIAPAFALQDLNGKQVSLFDFEGKVVLLDFWATWCPPCRKSIPHIQALYSKYKDRGFVVIGMNDERDHAKVRSFARGRISYTVLLDADKQFGQYAVKGIPTAFFLDRKGTIRYRDVGFGTGSEKAMERKIKELLGP